MKGTLQLAFKPLGHPKSSSREKTPTRNIVYAHARLFVSGRCDSIRIHIVPLTYSQLLCYFYVATWGYIYLLHRAWQDFHLRKLY